MVRFLGNRAHPADRFDSPLVTNRAENRGDALSQVAEELTVAAQIGIACLARRRDCEKRRMGLFNIYCDESCHLENDLQPVMLFGAVWCPSEKSHEIAINIRRIKTDHGLPRTFEIKWSKVSPAKVSFYRDILSYFVTENDLHFRALIVSHKERLRHPHFEQDHDTFYFKMYFTLLKVIISPQSRYRIYVDLKDTNSSDKVRKLHEVLSNNMYDFSRSIIERIQIVHSHEVEQVQLADFLLGAISYVNRELTTSTAKQVLVNDLQRKTGYSLQRTTLLREEKLNIFKWEPSEVEQ